MCRVPRAEAPVTAATLDSARSTAAITSRQCSRNTWPASVRFIERVVRVNRRLPSESSSDWMR